MRLKQCHLNRWWEIHRQNLAWLGLICWYRRDGGTRPGREELNSDEESESDDDYQYDNASGAWKLKRRPGRRRGSGRGSGSGRERKTLTKTNKTISGKQIIGSSY